MASAISPTVRLTVIARQGGEAGTIAVTLTWEDIFGGEHGLTERISLPALIVRPPLQLPLTPGGIQTIRGQFGPGEAVTVWAAMPDGAPRATLALPPTEADGAGVVRVDCRQAPRGFAGIVVQGKSLRNLVVLVPRGATAALPRLLSGGGALGRRAFARLRGRRGPREGR